MTPKQHGDQPDKMQETIQAYQSEDDLHKNYRQIAQQLRASQSLDQVTLALEPITAQSEETQIAFIKKLGKENAVEAADIIAAIHVLSGNKPVRKEARRRMLQLEGSNIYAEWVPPVSPSLGQALEQLTNPGVASEDNPFMSELQSLFSGTEGLFSGPAYIDVIDNFLTAWGEGDFEGAYSCLATDSPLRENLSAEAWIQQRKLWFDNAQPVDLKVAFMEPIKDEEGHELPIIDVGWSLELDNTTTPLKELPHATIVFKGTGRHWFWSRYSVVEEEDEWYINEMSDEGANVLPLSIDELQQRITDIRQLAELEVEGMEDEDDEDEDDLADEFDNDEEEIDESDEEFEDDEDDEDEGEDDEEEMEEQLADVFARFGALTRLTTQAMHYSDAIIAQAPTADASVYKQATDQALSIGEIERAAAYMQLMAENIPAERDVALRNFSLLCMALVGRYNDEDDEEQATHFASLAESSLREAMSIKADPKTAIILANTLMQQEKDVEEAESLLLTAKESATEPNDLFSIEMGLAAIADSKSDREMALNHFKHAAHIKPEDQEVWFQIGYNQSQLNQYAEAIPSFEQSIKINPELTEAYTELAGIYVAQEKFDKARAIIRRGLEINPDAVDLMAGLALVYMYSGDLRSAEKYLEQAEEIDDEDELVQEARQRFNELKKQLRSNSKNPKHNKAKKR